MGGPCAAVVTMSSAGISFGGLASGLDTRAIISALVAVERRPITALEQKKAGYTRQKSLFGDLGGLLDKLETAAKALKTTSDFLKMKATSDDETILTASASSSATPGSYTVRVDRLATAQINSVGRASPTDPIGGAATTVEFQIDANGLSVPISADSNLQSIAAAINDADAANGLGVRAEVIDTGNPDPNVRYELVLRGAEPGAANAFSISYTDGPPEFDQLIQDLNANQRDAVDAKLDVNGVTVYRATNTIGDLFAGITLDLRSADPTKDVTITVATDGEETGKKVKDLVDAYNALVDFFGAQSALDAEGKATSPLFGDPTLRSIRSTLRSIVGGSVTTTGNEAYQLLSQVGITADKDGKLTFNQGRFEEALADDEQAVTRLFTDSTSGITARLQDQIDVYTDSVDGLLKARNDGFDRLVKQASSRIDQAERRLTLYQQQLEAKYANLETLLARLQGQGSSVGSIASLNFNR